MTDALDVRDTLECPACGSPIDTLAGRLSYPGGASQSDPDRPRWIVDCAACGLGVAIPQLTDEQADALYARGEYWGAGEPEALLPRLHPGHYALAKARWEYVAPHLPERDLVVLDVGAGHGFLGLAALRDTRASVRRYVAVESDGILRESIAMTWQRLGASGQIRTTDRLENLSEGRYDVVVLSNVLEHLNEPEAMLSGVAALMAEDGVLFAESPRRDERFKADVYPHVLFFDERSLGTLLERAGLDVLDVGAFGRTPADSPISARNSSRLEVRLTQRLFGLRRLLPQAAGVAYFARYYGAARRGTDGTWVRGLARRRRDGAGPAK